MSRVAPGRIEAICRRAPVIPVLVIDDAAIAEPLARALVAGGLPILEVTLRTDAALDAIKAMTRVPGATVGAGTVLNARDLERAKQAGAEFTVSPGSTDALLSASEAANMPLLPGAATASEAMHLLDSGYGVQKFFPASAAGGAPMLKALSGPLPQIRFCPTGGIGLDNAPDYLGLPNVLCVGGSWITPAHLVQRGEWEAIEALARQAAELPRP
ncbi:bifunctional 4-hydroxy-2-oxoglutarate aldolase/2-dehydro-3-deoxy-phosphogluconate aldolase [Sediminimonas qiaohouensis]|uniref:bifunctional 4-hydroxy-2-oxoglutarate aldolase/2-dehydro-3-deoxy-phosphogluconate aldolase n=1 Tax=Sediminimonas qiaohouensis TaxID=552061 RepID=UPI002352AFA1|nr:bifunctional 4-hydroxy-2-oxoglutarate aldolase/2-dehydro-3-deoxy-phosphogluconate aldolase [Sediminimonas qiaohouensis]